MSMDFKDKVAVVTGSSRSIGRGVALAFAREGCALVINYRKSRDEADEVVKTIKEMGGKAIVVQCDVSKREDVEAMFKAVIDEYGKVDILVNNAGIASGGSILETTDESWDSQMAVNLKGVFLCSQIAARLMVERKYGKIVNISSNSGFGIAMDGETSYAVSKAGVIQLTKSCAYDLGPYGINVNCVAPGAVDTVMLQGSRSDEEYAKVLQGRIDRASLGIYGTPEDIANAVLFFANDKSRYITGKILLVDGGRKDFL
ncbi:3-oxoacyl-ACP reductase FabG [Candidatus Bathyarchaeota archaeon]|nr:3-oxoacyl-ACP reductase FabG [Candidatus Bathyarchaeota archaeon]MBT4320388.1 3-oxoacyl-ACP reductase FabG [Candidatus Bathyarchaeota archaeon]MBT4425217.1 3-oxoacyl-ACP reductase FabG [Candidatus Bathyarchaeota archaeon]MBT6604361.1 3-oxoacyl-ACP reductase FabG [Candidatus Bathyarchaeota archaeon]MBT7185913.1 3-oxoacyl-ACP reductase FabG [Candidatus Bathyarchaeota archaeon]